MSRLAHSIGVVQQDWLEFFPLVSIFLWAKASVEACAAKGRPLSLLMFTKSSFSPTLSRYLLPPPPLPLSRRGIFRQ